MVAVMRNGFRTPPDASWPLNAPGMPEPGPDFKIHAMTIDGLDGEYSPETLDGLYRRALREPGFSIPITVRGTVRLPTTFVCGHIWGQHFSEWAEAQADPRVVPRLVDGPHQADVMVIGKMPGRDEIAARRNFVGPSGQVLVDALKGCGVRGFDKWYITNLVKFQPPIEGRTTLTKVWIDDCWPILAAELRIVRPKYILCTGADASAAILGKGHGVGAMEGRVVTIRYDCRQSEDDPPDEHEALVMTVLHPVEVVRGTPDRARLFHRNISRFARLVSGHRFDLVDPDIDHRTITTLEEAQAWVKEVDADMALKPQADRLIAWDLEWEGRSPTEPGSYVRTVQASWKPRSAVVFKLAHAGGKPSFVDAKNRNATKRLWKLLHEFALDKRAVGHFFISDLEWTIPNGFDPTAGCQIPLEPENGKQPWELMKEGRGWIDTSAAAHAIEETSYLGLESVMLRYTDGVPRYDLSLEAWKKEYAKEQGISVKAIKGFGNCPDPTLLPYAAWDADVSLRSALGILPYLSRDYDGLDQWEPFWESMAIQPVILDMHVNGALIDRPRYNVQTGQFSQARGRLLTELQKFAKWEPFDLEPNKKGVVKEDPGFNPRSPFEVREFLFGEDLNGHPRNDDGTARRLRPDGAITLGLEPVVDTSKPAKRWSDIVSAERVEHSTASTGKTTLSVLLHETQGQQQEGVRLIRDFRFIDQVVKAFLRPPGDDDGYYDEETGEFVYAKGLGSFIGYDGRIHSRFAPTTETSRFRSWNPNFQNLSSQRETDYERILGPLYGHSIRSMVCARPGFSLVEFDYTGAELGTMAVLSGDPLMLEHYRRNCLPQDHPDFYDIHCHVAVLAFRLNVAPHPKAFRDAKSAANPNGITYIRTIAKRVAFGLAYGRGAKAISMEAREAGVSLSIDDAQAVIDTILTLYPGLVRLFDGLAARVGDQHERYIRTPWQRTRRFAFTSDRGILGDNERQAKNFPIQATVAGCVNRGLPLLRKAIHDQGLEDDVFFVLQLHDAAMLEVRDCYVNDVALKLIPWAMTDRILIRPTDYRGRPIEGKPLRLSTEIKVYHHWTEKYTADECRDRGIDVSLAS